jgi:hypothetical protein
MIRSVALLKPELRSWSSQRNEPSTVAQKSIPKVGPELGKYPSSTLKTATEARLRPEKEGCGTGKTRGGVNPGGTVRIAAGWRARGWAHEAQRARVAP